VPSTELVFTLDEGKTFKECNFTDVPVDIRNIMVVPYWTSRKFILWGLRDSKAVVIHFDMTNTLPRQCIESDYEWWVPTFAGRECLLGQKVEFRRKKQDSVCFNGEEHETRQVVTNCTCTIEDYECDFCFDYDEQTQQCVFGCTEDSEQIKKLPFPPLNCKDFYEAVGIGWRKVSNDKCDDTPQDSIRIPNLKAYIPCKLNHTNEEPAGKGVNIIVGVVVTLTIIVALVGSVVLLYKKNQRFHDCIKYTFDSPSARPSTKEYKQVSVNTDLEDVLKDDDEETDTVDDNEDL